MTFLTFFLTFLINLDTLCIFDILWKFLHFLLFYVFDIFWRFWIFFTFSIFWHFWHSFRFFDIFDNFRIFVKSTYPYQINLPILNPFTYTKPLCLHQTTLWYTQPLCLHPASLPTSTSSRPTYPIILQPNSKATHIQYAFRMSSSYYIQLSWIDFIQN